MKTTDNTIKMTDRTPAQQFINFMYFANNYSIDELNNMFKVTSAPDHLKSKFSNQHESGTPALFTWLMQLSDGDKESVFNYVQSVYDNYKNQ